MLYLYSQNLHFFLLLMWYSTLWLGLDKGMVYVVENTLVTRRVPHVEQELHALHEHQNSPQVFSGVRDARLLVFCVMFCRSLFVLLSRFVLVIVLSPLLRLMTSDYLFGTIKLFLLFYYL